MTSAIRPWRAAPEPSHFDTVPELVAYLKASARGVSDASQAGQAANRALPKSRPLARAFMAWECYYQKDHVAARRTALAAMNGE